MYYVGLDAHARSFNGDILDCNGKLFKRFDIRGSRSDLLAEMKKIPGPFRVCYEASCGYGVLHDDLATVAQTVKVAHPGHLRLIFRSKRKNNKIDGAKLAKILYLDAVPAIHVPNIDVRSWRQTIEFRRKLLDERVQIKNRIRALLRGQGIDPPKSLWTKKGMNWLKKLELNNACAIQRDILTSDLEGQAGKIKLVEKHLGEVADRHPGIALLRTIPGVGPRTAEALIAYIDDVKRFGSVKQVGAYFGLVPCQDATGDKNRLGHITRDGPATVRKLLCEASWTGIRRSPTLRAFFERVMRNDPQRKKIALVATAHHLVRVTTAMLRSGECWHESQGPGAKTAHARKKETAKEFLAGIPHKASGSPIARSSPPSPPGGPVCCSVPLPDGRKPRRTGDDPLASCSRDPQTTGEKRQASRKCRR
jgi:transposase